MSWSRRTFLVGTAAAAVSTPAWGKKQRPPSVLILYPDQLRASALSHNGERNIRTKVLDGFVKSGGSCALTCTTNPVCAPARGSLLTGLYATSHGVIKNGQRLRARVPSLGRALSRAGYRTGFIGKWHLDGKARPGFVPPERRHGFDYWAAYNFGHAYRHSVYFEDRDKPLRPDPPDRFEPEYQTDLALKFMRKNRKKPFFLVLGYGPPHPPGTAPIQDWSVDVPQRYLDRVDPAALELAPNVPDWIRVPNRGANGNSDTEPGARHHLQGYYASILAIEDSIARVLRGVEDLGLAARTVVVLTSDHGEMGGAHGWYQKGQPYEEAARVPLVFRWPGHIERGRRLDRPVSTADIMPTVLRLCGLEPPRHHGRDLSGWLLGGRDPKRDGVLVQGRLERKGQAWRMVRTEKWTYAEYTGGKAVLYDSVADPHQLQNLVGDDGHRPTVAAMSRLLASLREDVGDT